MKAKRGDLVIYETKHITTDKDFKRTVTEKFYVGVAKLVTQDGIVKVVEYPAWSDPINGMYTQLVDIAEKVYIVPKERIDIEGALNEFRSHVYEPSSTGMVKPYDNEVEVKKALKPYLIGNNHA